MSKRLIKNAGVYTYTFHSPICFLITGENMEDKYVSAKDIEDNIIETANRSLMNMTRNFKSYVNMNGCNAVSFRIKNDINTRDILETVYTFDHRLDEDEYKSLRNEIYGQLHDGIGERFSKVLIDTYEDKNIEEKQGFLEKSNIVKKVYCYLVDDDNWFLDLQ